ncbi:putative (di)nucleoside polyphosphate hydrolase [Rhodovulum iodosum]|uniref:RNA pyrophosphohydrolase n=1 Tax=Rhodovulum iodosum TaxID=68291 RepID=A0ABV3XQI8_9RHOB|nr:RNA pyrophosphohydrolase [Rhodovulum robiginosum]RSK32974.1 RNA pyrophosphohydrolase [Rhodovulum robiginosum]
MTPEEAEKLPYRPCVGVMLTNAEGRVFVGQRNDYEMPAWQMPQGGIDAGETPEAAALRELWEETGVSADLVEVVGRTSDWVHYDLPPDLLGKLWKGRYRGQKQIWFLMRFLGTDAQINIATEHPEFVEWAWLDPAHLVESIVPFKRDVYAHVVGELVPKIAPTG